MIRDGRGWYQREAGYDYKIFPIHVLQYSEIHRNLQIPKVRLEYAKRSCYFSGVKNWNDIPGNIREQESLARFKKRFRKYLQNLQDPNTTHW